MQVVSAKALPPFIMHRARRLSALRLITLATKFCLVWSANHVGA